jgi:hypothetical protein
MASPAVVLTAGHTVRLYGPTIAFHARLAPYPPDSDFGALQARFRAA